MHGVMQAFSVSVQCMLQLIGSIPYTGNGTTVGFSQDYQPVGCSGSAQSSVQTAAVLPSRQD